MAVHIENRRARHEYFILETYEAGLMLCGTEVKSLRDGRCQLLDSYVAISKGEAWLYNVRIDEYTAGNRWNHEHSRARKLLLHKKEIEGLARSVDRKGLTIVPLEVYFKDSWAKVKVAVCKGKAEHDKRQTKIAADHKREIDRAMKKALR
ncbi:MAG TPA: SsrA-binding protein SmpB [Fibrobacteria bacterium]|nr:SsrA-binding protein SmpB [Fibrobacteria bacterium]HOX53247.1 SsrA-binding protein SmpB [Fibrobacteria bacterium]